MVLEGECGIMGMTAVASRVLELSESGYMGKTTLQRDRFTSWPVLPMTNLSLSFQRLFDRSISEEND